MSENITIQASADTLRALFGSNFAAPAAPTASIPEGMARLSFAGQTVDIDPDMYANVADAFAANGEALGLNTARVVTFSVSGEVIPAADPVEPGIEYAATTKHDDKG